MDDLKRLGELVDGNVEHIKTLGLLYKLGAWKPILEFLSQTRLANPRTIQLVRKLLAEYQDCPNDAALKKKYLEIRIRRVVAGKKNISDEEQVRLAEERKSHLLSQMNQLAERIRKIKTRKQSNQCRDIAASHLFTQRKQIETLWQNLSTSLELANGHDPLLITADRQQPHHAIAVVSSSTEAELKNFIQNRLYNEDDTFVIERTRQSQEIILTLTKVVKDLTVRVRALPEKQMRASMETINETREATIITKEYPNIQKVTLELAKLLILLWNGGDKEREIAMIEFEKLVAILRECPNSFEDATSRELARTLLFDKIHGSGMETSLALNNAINETCSMTSKIIQAYESLKKEQRILFETIYNVISNLKDSNEFDDDNQLAMPLMMNIPTNPFGADTWKVLVKHSLKATIPADIEGTIHKVEGLDQFLDEQIMATKIKVENIYNTASNGSNEFALDCNSLQRTFEKKTRDMIRSIIQQQL